MRMLRMVLGLLQVVEETGRKQKVQQAKGNSNEEGLQRTRVIIQEWSVPSLDCRENSANMLSSF